MSTQLIHAIRSTGSIALIAALTYGLLLTTSGPTIAKCPSFDSWPSFTELVPTARRIVIGTITGSVDGRATEVRVEEVLRGESRQYIDLDRLAARLPRWDEATCDFDAAIYAEEGDRIALAFNGKLVGRKGRVDTVALVDALPDQPNRTGLERLATGAVRALAGHAADGSTLPDDGGVIRPTDPLFEVRRALRDSVGDLPRDIIDALFSVPWPARPPAPLPAGATALDLATLPAAPPRPPGGWGWGCNDAAFTGRLIVEDAALVVEGSPVVWPRGFSARIVDGRGELVAPDGTVVGGEGETIEAGGGSVPGDAYFIACTVGGVAYSPAS